MQRGRNLPPPSSKKSITAFMKVVKGRHYTGSFCYVQIWENEL
nr:MAG TPA: hypothetical protein [Caudoviricetes sp.]DAW18832.1 MAG TPA: hypothetical protein [Bacteriophage sp.]